MDGPAGGDAIIEVIGRKRWQDWLREEERKEGSDRYDKPTSVFPSITFLLQPYYY